MKVYVFIALIQILAPIHAKRFVNRQCSTYNTTQTNAELFQFDRFVGQWYEIAKYENENQTQTIKSCSVHNITYNPYLHRSQVTTYTKQKFLQYTLTNGTITPTLNGLSWHSNVKDEDVIVLGTDYTTYAVLWKCIDHPFNVSSQNVTILSKHLTFPHLLPKVGDILASTGIQNDSIPFNLIERDQCPVVNPGNGFWYGPAGNNTTSGGFEGYSPGHGRPNSALHPTINLSAFFMTIFLANFA